LRVLWHLKHPRDGLVSECDSGIIWGAAAYILDLRVLQDPVVPGPELSLGPIEELQVCLLRTNLTLEAEELRDERILDADEAI
jgi:hypothetical protein